MKINEVLTEGPLDFAKKVGAFATGGTAGWQSQGAANATANQTNTVIVGALKKWSELAQHITASGQEATPEQAKAWFTKFTGVAPSVAPGATDPATIKQWLTTEVNRFLANRAQATDTTAPAPTATAGQPMATPMSTPSGVSIISPDPLVLRYKNTDYAQNNQGEWTRFNSTKPLLPTEQAFFDKQMDILHPATPTATAQPTASAQPTATAQPTASAQPTAQPAIPGMPDISTMTPADIAELRAQLVASMQAGT